MSKYKYKTVNLTDKRYEKRKSETKKSGYPMSKILEMPKHGTIEEYKQAARNIINAVESMTKWSIRALK